MAKVEVLAEFEAIVVRINGLLAIYLERHRLRAIQSWIMDSGKQFFIQFHMSDGDFTVDYHSEELWKEILRGLDNVLIAKRFMRANLENSPAALNIHQRGEGK
jgi:hypothetical protein